MLRALFWRKVDIDGIDSDGWAAIHHDAYEEGKHEMLLVLCENGANLEVPSAAFTKVRSRCYIVGPGCQQTEPSHHKIQGRCYDLLEWRMHDPSRPRSERVKRAGRTKLVAEEVERAKCQKCQKC
jgi:hypothetical protein